MEHWEHRFYEQERTQEAWEERYENELDEIMPYFKDLEGAFEFLTEEYDENGAYQEIVECMPQSIFVEDVYEWSIEKLIDYIKSNDAEKKTMENLVYTAEAIAEKIADRG